MSNPAFVPLTKESLQKMNTKENYRLITRQELEAIGFVFPTDKYKEHIKFARKYYPSEATSMVLAINSEYNDNTYNNSLAYVVVYDKNGNELVPLKETAKECRQNWYDLPIPGVIDSYNETGEKMDDVVISLLNDVPELYIKQ